MPTITQPTLSASLSRRLRLVWTAIVIFVLTLGTTQGALAATGADKSEAVGSEVIDDLIQDRMNAHGIPGAAVAVVRGSEVVHLAGYGKADSTGRIVDPVGAVQVESRLMVQGSAVIECSSSGLLLSCRVLGGLLSR